MKYYKLSYDDIKEFNFLGGVFLLDRIRSEESNYHFIKTIDGGYEILAADQDAVEFASDNGFDEISLKQEKNIKINEVAFDTLSLSRSILRSPGDEKILTNNSDVIIEMVILLKELFTIFGLPVAYWKQFLRSPNKEIVTQIRNSIIAQIRTKKQPP